MELRAAAGEVRWVYHQAAVLESCVVTRAENKTHYYVVAKVVSANPFILEHSRPLVFVLTLAGGHTWRWPIETCGINDEEGHGIVFRAYVGPSLKG